MSESTSKRNSMEIGSVYKMWQTISKVFENIQSVNVHVIHKTGNTNIFLKTWAGDEKSFFVLTAWRYELISSQLEISIIGNGFVKTLPIVTFNTESHRTCSFSGAHTFLSVLPQSPSSARPKLYYSIFYSSIGVGYTWGPTSYTGQKFRRAKKKSRWIFARISPKFWPELDTLAQCPLPPVSYAYICMVWKLDVCLYYWNSHFLINEVFLLNTIECLGQSTFHP